MDAGLDVVMDAGMDVAGRKVCAVQEMGSPTRAGGTHFEATHNPRLTT
jgi:hypothetical protein